MFFQGFHSATTVPALAANLLGWSRWHWWLTGRPRAACTTCQASKPFKASQATQLIKHAWGQTTKATHLTQKCFKLSHIAHATQASRKSTWEATCESTTLPLSFEP